MNTQQKKTELCWLDKPYIPGCIFNHLTAMEYQTVVSLDIGHGECVAYQYLKNHAGDWVAEPLSLSEEENKSVLSYVAYVQENGVEKAVIGSDAAASNGQLLTYYKTEPSEWEEPHRYDPHHTNGQILKDFITKMWAGILSGNEKLRDTDKNKVLITIGCPASPAWTSEKNMAKYCKLAKEATGYPNVIIIPESTAAIMSAIYSKLGSKIRLEKGIAVYDLGSSTIDFTFILMGKIIVTRSLRLGGSNIDLALLELVSRKNSKQKDLDPAMEKTLYKTEMLLPKERNKACAQLRTAKERYFRNGENALEEKSLPLKEDIRIAIDPNWVHSTGLSDPEEISGELWRKLMRTSLKGRTTSMQKENEYLEQIAACVAQVQKTGKAMTMCINFQQDLTYVLDKALMDQALQLICWDQLNEPYTGLNWEKAVKAFFVNTRSLIQEYGCGAVILTGGTSKVSCVRRIADECYGKGCVHNEPDTSVSVARGMCHATGKEVAAAQLLPGIKEKLVQVQKEQFRVFCTGVAYYQLFDLFWDACGEAAATLCDGKAHIKADLVNVVEMKTVRNPAFIRKVQIAIQEYVGAFWTQCVRYNYCPQTDSSKKHECSGCELSMSCAETIRRAVNDLSVQVYKACVTELPELPQDLLKDVGEVMKRDGIASMLSKIKPETLIPDIAVNYWWRNRENAPFVERMIEGAVRGTVRIVERMRDTLSPEKCSDMAAAFDRETARMNERSNFSRKLSKSLQASPELSSAFSKLLDQQLEIALGIVLFQIFQGADMT